MSHSSLTDEQAIDFTKSRLEKVKGCFSKNAHKKHSKDRLYILGATLQYRAAKNGGAVGLIAYWSKLQA